MKYCNGILIGVVALTLQGCGGSKTNGIPALNLIGNDGPNPSPSDFPNDGDQIVQGRGEFRAYYAQGSGTSTFSNGKYVSQGVVTAKFSDEGELEIVTKSGGTRNYERLYSSTDLEGVTRHGFNEIEGDGRVRIIEFPEGFAAGRILDENLSASGNGDLSFHFGLLTDPVVLPTGRAVYVQEGIGQENGIVYLSVNGAPPLSSEGAVNLTANFDDNTIFGTLFEGQVEDSDLRVSLSGGKIVGSEFYADDGISVSFKDPSDLTRTVVASSGELLGQFSGLNGDAAIGSYGGTFSTEGSSGSDDFEFSGVFRNPRVD